METFDLIVIGAGPGGYVAAIRAAQNGLKVACVEKRSTLGGTCLNVGCIPSKALLNSSEKFDEAKHDFDNHGIVTSSVKMDIKKMMARKESVVDGLTKGIEFLFKKNKVTWLKGEAQFVSDQEINVINGKEKNSYKAKNFLIATGSESAALPGVDVDEKTIVSSTGALSLTKTPKKMVVIGGGYIGLEMGSVWARLGSEVTVVEYLDTITPAMDKEISKTLMKTLKKQGFEFKLGTKVTGAKKTKTGVTLTVEAAQGGNKEKIEADIVLVSIGRRPYTDSLSLDKAGVACDERGFIQVNKAFQTSKAHIYAIGDVIGGAMLAHKAEDEGVICADTLVGKAHAMRYDTIPGVIYTWPEAASVGFTEEELKEAGIAYDVGKFPFQANSRARSNGGCVDGFVKIIAAKDSQKVIGAHIIGPDAGTMIAEAAMAIELGVTAEKMAHICHAHPTLNEAVKEAALDVTKQAIHI